VLNVKKPVQHCPNAFRRDAGISGLFNKPVWSLVCLEKKLAKLQQSNYPGGKQSVDGNGIGTSNLKNINFIYGHVSQSLDDRQPLKIFGQSV
jgi:hypothetical protein